MKTATSSLLLFPPGIAAAVLPAPPPLQDFVLVKRQRRLGDISVLPLGQFSPSSSAAPATLPPIAAERQCM